jgi:hypothetical protein
MRHIIRTEAYDGTVRVVAVTPTQTGIGAASPESIAREWARTRHGELCRRVVELTDRTTARALRESLVEAEITA